MKKTSTMKLLPLLLFLICALTTPILNAQINIGTNTNLGHTGKGIIPDQGANDPHIHIFDNKAYLFASHDTIIGDKNTTYMMPNWNIYSSEDLVNWEKEFVLYPENTYIGESIDKCFATDGATRNGKYYFYFSNFNINTGVAVSDNPGGPYRDTGAPIIAKNETNNLQKNYDPTIFIDDDGKHYIIYGQTGWNNNYYQIAELNEDMVSLKTEPRDLLMSDNTKIKRDASYLHKHNGIYYLSSHHGQYARSENLYGPYDYVGEVECGGDHGTYFTWHNQTYYTAGAWQAPYFRYTFITYVHYKENGDIVAKRPIEGNYEIGVGRYDCDLGAIEAECYFAASDGLQKKENAADFEIHNITDGSYLFYPKVFNISEDAEIEFRVSSAHAEGGTIEVRQGSTSGTLLAECEVKPTGGWDKYVNVSCALPNMDSPQNLYLVFKGKDGDLMHLDRFKISEKGADVLASIEFDDDAKYKNNAYEVGSSIEVKCNYHAGTGNTVAATEDGIKFFLKELDKDWKAVNQYVVTEPSVIGTESGSTRANISLEGIPASEDLEEGNFYYLFILFENSAGEKLKSGLSPIQIIATPTNVKALKKDVIKTYPNPLSDRLYFTNGGNINAINIFNATGHLLKTEKIDSNMDSISFKEYDKGIYLVQFQLADKTHEIERIIKI